MQDDFKKEFLQGVKQSTVTPHEAIISPTTNDAPFVDDGGQNKSALSKILLVVFIVLSVVEFIAIIILVNNRSLSNKAIGESTDLATEEDEEDVLDAEESELTSKIKYSFDENGNIVAMNLTCTNKNGASFSFDQDRTYRENGGSSATNSGAYSVSYGELIVIANSRGEEKTLFYDGLLLFDGKEVYNCE